MRPVRCWGVHISVVLRVEGTCYLDLCEASIKALRLSIKSKWNWFRKKILMQKLTHLNFWALRYLMERVIMCRRTKRDFKLAEWEEIDSNRCEGHMSGDLWRGKWTTQHHAQLSLWDHGQMKHLQTRSSMESRSGRAPWICLKGSFKAYPLTVTLKATEMWRPSTLSW